ncbi:arsenate-mycothiol transferase ArsC [Paenimyroides aestuarii]|uniref:Protein-tyrosine-phosphatase n=1 Tax=Paenimyroides aestuarii TaxID=2968490 RepID=A0ABY5NRE8_9FLAO|nr:protein-tyrosine-phosphatase [Paenimyroides aestuarii]UUV21143.1 protein-tyrosine-phosphatase [Paenimyroides aestuarii]
MYPTLSKTVKSLPPIPTERKIILQPLIDFVQQKIADKQEININFICTHNSRRSHLAQIWAQVAAAHFHIPHVQCYSGGTETTAVYPTIVDTLQNQGFNILKLSEGNNPVYAIKYNENSNSIIGFSKKYDDDFTPKSAFAAVMTCSQADGGCPFISGAEKRIPITFEDPKIADNTPEQSKVYAERSLQIAAEMFYIFSKINL